MKALVATVVSVGGVIAAVVFLWPAPGTGPEPLRYGVDACAECRMPVGRPGFGGELRDADGRLTTYDDVGCLVRALQKRSAGTSQAWVEDHAGGGFVALRDAILVGAVAETPMGSGLLAFRDERAARDFAAQRGGGIVSLGDAARDRPASAAKGMGTAR